MDTGLQWSGGPVLLMRGFFLSGGTSAADQYRGTARSKPSIIPKCLRFLVTNVRPSSIAVAATSESKTWGLRRILWVS